MACGANHSGAVVGGKTSEGMVFLWGNGSNFRLGNSDTQEQETPQQVTAMHPGMAPPVTLHTPYPIPAWLRPSPSAPSITPRLSSAPAHPISN